MATVTLRCPSHPDADLIDDHRAGDVVCSRCGLVVGDRVVDVGTEWRSFNNEKSCKDPSRVGAPENSLLSSGDLSTSIAAGPGSSDWGVAKLQRRTVNSTDRALMQAMGVIREMSERVHLPRSIQDQAARIYKDVLETKQLKGKNPSAVAAACLYIACRKEQVPRSFKEICAISQQVSKKEIGRCFKLILKALETSLDHLTSVDFMSRFCSNLSLDPHGARQLQLTATHIAKKAFELDCVPGRSPISVAAAAIYLASLALNMNKSAKGYETVLPPGPFLLPCYQKKFSTMPHLAEIGEIAGAAETTVKNTYKLLLPSAQQLFPDNFNFIVPIARLPMS